MKSRKLVNWLLYSLAALFLLYHLLPVGSAITQLAPEKQTRIELANASQCDARRNELLVPTYGNPLTQPLVRDLAARNQFVSPPAPTSTLYEQAATKSLADWESSRYGNNDGRTTIVNGENPSTATFRVAIDKLQDGDTKWIGPRIDTAPGNYVTVSFMYRGNTDFKPTAIFIDTDSDTKYTPQRVITAQGDWKTASVDFIAPPATKQFRFAANLEDQGWLETKDILITSRPAPQFSRGIATFTFDDGWKTIHEQGLPLFQKYGIKTTQYIVADYEGNPAYMNKKLLDDFIAAGHDIGSHSYSHANLTTLGDERLRQETTGSWNVLNSEYGGVNNFAAPFGYYDDRVQAAIRQCYQSHRTTDSGFNAAGYDRYQIKVQNVEVDTKPEEIRRWADFARDNKLWLVLVYHQVESGGEYSVDTRVLESHLRAVQESGIHTATFEEALLETYPQGR